MLFVFRLLSLLICSTAVCVSTVNGQCSNGFIEQSSLAGLVNAAVTRPEGYQYLFFSINFTCQVEVSGFILLATDDDGVGEYPFIQIWREVSTNFYNRTHNIGSSDEVTFLGNSLYQYTPTSGNITVLPGDILGLLALSNSNSRVTPYLLNQSSPQYYEISAGLSQLTLTQIFANNQLNLRNQYSPLVAIELNLVNPISSLVYPSSYMSLTSTDYSALIMTSSSRMYFVPTTVSILSTSSSPLLSTFTLLTSSSFSTTSTPSLSSPTILSPVLAGVIGGSIVAVVGVIVCLLVIAVHCVKKKVHYSETNGRAALDSQTLPSINIEQRSNVAYNHPTNGSATEMQSNAAYARSSANFNVPVVEGTEVDTYATIQEEDNDNYI